MKKLTLIAGLAVLAASAGALATFAQGLNSSGVVRDSWSVKGLSAPAELVVDHWGVPHIFAGSQRDAFFLQGYNAARDRLWQIDLWRKRGLGLLAKSLGPAYVEQDRAARLFLYRGDMNAEWNAYSPDARTSVEAFTAGINAYVAEVEAGKKPLPVEFNLTQSDPEEWQPQDVLRVRSHALVSNVTSEVARARVACAAGVDADELRRKLDPENHKRAVPAGLNPCDVPTDVLDDYVLATQQVEFQPLVKKQRAAIDPETRLADLMDRQLNEGSNTTHFSVIDAQGTTGSYRRRSRKPAAPSSPTIHIANLACPRFATSSVSTRQVSTSSGQVSRRCQVSPSVTTTTSLLASPFSRWIRKTSTSTKPTPTIPTCTATMAGGSG